MILYTIGCPKCNILETKLKAKGITFEECRDKKIMQEKGITTLPVLVLDDGTQLTYLDAVKWVNNK